MSHPFGKSPETQVIWSIIRTKLQILPSYHSCISKVFPLPKKKKKKKNIEWWMAMICVVWRYLGLKKKKKLSV